MVKHMTQPRFVTIQMDRPIAEIYSNWGNHGCEPEPGWRLGPLGHCSVERWDGGEDHHQRATLNASEGQLPAGPSQSQ